MEAMAEVLANNVMLASCSWAMDKFHSIPNIRERPPFCQSLCAPPAPIDKAPILLFNGTGTSPNDVKAVERVLKARHLDFATVASRQLNKMNAAQLLARLLLKTPRGAT